MADDLPERGVQDPRVRRIHREVRRARLVVDVQDLLPRFAAVLGTEDAALGVRAPDVALRRDVDEVGVLRVHAHARDLARVLESHVLPGAAGVGRLVHAVAVRGVAADRLFAGADVDDVRIGLGDGDRADRAGPEILVGDDLPVRAAVARLPDAPARRAEVEGARIVAHARDRRDATAPERPDRPELDPSNWSERLFGSAPCPWASSPTERARPPSRERRAGRTGPGLNSTSHDSPLRTRIHRSDCEIICGAHRAPAWNSGT
jgi:hypothetical protein